jgi:hypothetical protein
LYIFFLLVDYSSIIASVLKNVSLVAMTYLKRIFVHLPTGEVFEVAASESHLSKLRRAIVEDCGGDPEWVNQTIFQHQVGFDIEKTGDIGGPVVQKWSGSSSHAGVWTGGGGQVRSPTARSFSRTRLWRRLCGWLRSAA